MTRQQRALARALVIAGIAVLSGSEAAERSEAQTYVSGTLSTQTWDETGGPYYLADDATLPERRLYISRIIDCVFVRPGRVPVPDRCWTLYRGEAPDDLSGQGRAPVPPRPFEPPGQAGWWREHWRPNQRWNDDKIAAELRAFLHDRDEWPPPSDFEWAHQTALLDAIRHHGGSVEWARRMGVRPCRRTA